MKTNTFVFLFSLVALAACSQHTVQAQSWLITGNGNTSVGTNFLGTTNKTGLAFRTNNLERMRITPAGNLGIGTTAPGSRLTVRTATSSYGLLHTDGMTSVGTYVGGFAGWYGTLTNHPLYFFVNNGGPSMTVAANGNVGIGVAPGNYKLKVSHGTRGLDIENAASGNDWELYTNSSGHLELYLNELFRGVFDPTTGAYSAVSDERLKSNVQPMSAVLGKISQLRPSTYQFTNGDGQFHDGFLAQEVMQVFPALVSHNVEQERNLDLYSLDYSGFGVIAIKGIQELQGTIDKQQQTIATMEQRITALETALAGRSR